MPLHNITLTLTASWPPALRRYRPPICQRWATYSNLGPTRIYTNQTQPTRPACVHLKKLMKNKIVGQKNVLNISCDEGILFLSICFGYKKIVITKKMLMMRKKVMMEFFLMGKNYACLYCVHWVLSVSRHLPTLPPLAPSGGNGLQGSLCINRNCRPS